MGNVLIGTRKGAWILTPEGKLSEPICFGQIIHHMVLDPRDGRTLLIAAKTGHLGPTVFRSTDRGATIKEASRPPAFAKAAEGEKGKTVEHVFWLTPGHASEPGVWYAGTSPQGLFRSEDGGDTWEPVAGFNDHPDNPKWTEGDGPPDGATLHSILIDPRDARHMYLGLSAGGVFESTDQGRDWQPLNCGCAVDFLPDPNVAYGHDPHCVAFSPANPDRLYQQNHCGIYRMDRSEGRWIRIGDNMPREVGDIGFPIAPHPRDANRAWVFPMDGGTVWPRTSPEGRPAAYHTRDGGTSWIRQDRGLPAANAWHTVFRQAMTLDPSPTVGLYFGTTSGEVWGSGDEGESWRLVCAHLPRIQSLEWVQFQ